MSSLIPVGRMQDFLGNAVAAVTVYVVFYDALGGVIRYLLLNLHAMFLNNLGSVLAMVLFCAYLFVSTLSLRMKRFMIFLTLMIGGYLVYAITDHLSFWQNAFGFYIWTGFLLGTLLCVYGKEESLFRYLPLLWLISVIGVLINAVVDVPWVGLDYEMNGVTMQTARKWSGYGFDRLAGFSRASYAAATIIAVSYCYIAVSKKYPALIKVAAYLLSCTAIFLTTSKTELVFVLLLPGILYVGRLLAKFGRSGTGDLFYARTLIAALAILVVLLPLMLSSHKDPSYSGPSYMFLTGETMLQRTNGMWPEAFDLLEKDGNILLGRGIGGVGIALGMSDPVPDSVNAADNIFVYVYVQAGLLAAIPFFLSFFLNWKAAYRKGPEYFECVYLLAVCCLSVGITAGAIEDPLLAILFGFFVARGYIRKPPEADLLVPHTSKDNDVIRDGRS